MDVAARRELNNGLGETLSRSFEFAVTPTIFGAIGYLIDNLLGTGVVFAIGLLILGLAGVLIRWYYDYVTRIDAVEQERELRRKETKVAAPVITRPDTSWPSLPTGITLDREVGEQ